MPATSPSCSMIPVNMTRNHNLLPHPAVVDILETKRLDDGTASLKVEYTSKASLVFDAGIQFVF